MKKSLFFAIALMSAAIFTSCGDTLTPDGDKTQLWPAGKNNSEKMGYINKSGNFKIDPKFDDCSRFSCGFAMAQQDEDIMFIDKSGKKVKTVDAADLYDYYFYYNLCRFKDGEFKGMWDTKFNVAIPADYKYLGEATKDGLIACSEDNKEYKYINAKGKTVITGDFVGIYPFQDGMAVVVEKNNDSPRFGVIDKKGNYIIEPQKNGLQSIGEGLLGMQKTNGKVVMIDKAMNEIGSAYDGSHGVFSCGLIGVYKSEKGYGFINKKGDEIVPCKYASVWNYTDNATWVKKDADSNWEALDTKGETLFKLKEDDAPSTGFHNGLALVLHTEKGDGFSYTYTYRYVNKKGDTVYKWTPGEDEEAAPAYNWEELDRRNFLQTEMGALVREIEEMNAMMAR